MNNPRPNTDNWLERLRALSDDRKQGIALAASAVIAVAIGALWVVGLRTGTLFSRPLVAQDQLPEQSQQQSPVSVLRDIFDDFSPTEFAPPTSFRQDDSVVE